MGFYLEELKRIWKEFGPAQKISMSLAALAILTALGGLLVWSSKPSMQLLYGRMSAQDITEAVNLLESHGIAYQIGAGGSSVMVPSDRVYSLRMELASRGVPSGGSVGFEIFDENNFGVSDFVQKTNYMRAVQGELSRTIAQMAGVRSARVMISVPENKLLAQQSNTRPTASVFVDTGGGILTDQSVNSIRFLVANSVEGLHVDEVAVVDNNGNVLSEALKGDGAFGISSSRLKYKQGMEDYYKNKIESMLTQVFGAHQVVARVSLDIDTEATTVLQEIYDPNGQVVRNQTVTEGTSLSDISEPKTVAGNAAAGKGGDFTSGSSATNTSKDITKKKTIAYEISHSKKEVVQGPGRIKELTAAVFLAIRKKDEGGKSVEVPRTPEEIEKIRLMIVNAIGVTESTGNVAQRVTIQEMPFAPTSGVLTPTVLGVPETLFSLFDKFKNYGSIFLALLMFFVLKRMLKKHKPKEMSFEFVEGQSSGGPLSGEKRPLSLATADVINELIQQKPENVSTVLKNWVSSGN